MYIGITERGDAGIDFSWVKQLQTNPAFQGAILITKNCNEQFQKEISGRNGRERNDFLYRTDQRRFKRCEYLLHLYGMERNQKS